MTEFLGKACVFVIVCVVIYVVIQIWAAVSNANAETRSIIASLKSNIDSLRSNLSNQEKNVSSIVLDFFASPAGNYSSAYNSVCSAIDSMKTTIAEMKKINRNLSINSPKEDQGDSINKMESGSIPRAEHIAEGLRSFGQKVYTLQRSRMIDEKSYGKVNKSYWDSVCAMRRDDAVNYIVRCEYLLGSGQFDELYAIDIEKIVKCVWFFATEKTFSAFDFQKAQNVFYRIYKYNHADVIIAGLYAKKKMGGEDVLRDPVRDLLKVQRDSHILTLVASGLMWMNAYQSENTVLQHMLTTGNQMSAKAQERLHSLTNGGGKAPSGFDVQSSASSLYFDVSALAWKDDEYIGLFENLAFQDKTLAYSLAVRDENKELFIPQGINVPSTADVLTKLKRVFAEEYGQGVVAQAANCIALSGAGEEKMDGILVSADENKQMGVLIHIARIGKKLIIKFYTLFMPTGTNLAAQKQQALSMFKKLSPNVTMWESSLKDTMLMAVEQLLNTNAQASPVQPNSGTSTEEPIF